MGVYLAYQDDLNSMRDNYNKRLGEKNAIIGTIDSLKLENDNAATLQEKNTQMSMLLKKAAELARDNAKAYLEEVGTLALQYVFDRDMSFVIDMADKAGRPEAEFFIQYTDGTEVVKVKPDDSCGGGVVDTLSIALRYAYLEQLHEPSIESGTLLDEPGKMISEAAASKMAQLLGDFKTTFGRQIIMVTHNDIYGQLADKTYTVFMAGVESKVVEGNVQIQVSDGEGNNSDVQLVDELTER